MQITNPRRFISLLLVVMAAAAAIGVWRYAAADVALQKSGDVEVAAGASASTIGENLVADGYIERSIPWRYHAWRQDAAPRIQAGTYHVERGERISQVLQRFVDGDTSPNEFTLTFPEGFTLEQMAERTAARGIGTKEEFVAAARPAAYKDQYPFLAELAADRTLEGYLFPDTYQVFADDTSANVVARMLATFNRKVVQGGLLEAAPRTPDQLVIMASIVEREVISDDDMELVSGVLWKRNDEGAGLDADATVRYALGKQTGPLTVQDLASESPYNTRRWKGLPPGPISNPGLRALTAAANPEESAFYYYLSAPSGETIFSKTNDEHNANKVKYLQ